MDKRAKAPQADEYLTEALADVDRRLRNWSRWSRGGFLTGPGHCGSIEHKYVAARDDDKSEVQQRRATEGVDALDAEVVEAVIAALPRREKALLGRIVIVQCRERAFIDSFYRKGHNWRETCRHIGRDPQMFQAEHVRALTVIGNALRSARAATRIARPSKYRSRAA